jgi:hypothetical protein
MPDQGANQETSEKVERAVPSALPELRLCRLIILRRRR